MSQPANLDTELLTEHFGYPPVSLLDDVINSINILAERALNSVEQGLLNAPPASLGFRESALGKSQAKAAKAQQAKAKGKGKGRGSAAVDEPDDPPPVSFEEAHRHEIENGTHQLETLLCASIDRNFDKFELYLMRNVLCVGPESRDWIRLGHYEGLDLSGIAAARREEGGGDNGGGGDDDAPGEGTDRPTVESVHRLRRRLQASQKLNVMLHAEHARNEALLGELRALVGGQKEHRAQVKNESSPEVPSTSTFGFLQNTGDLAVGDAETPITTTTAFTLSQLQALRALSTSLRNIVPDLEEAALAADSNLAQDEPDTRKSWRRERLEYVETATRKHLENVRGLELGKNGEVRDGEWQGEGRGIAKDEVEGLERVVTFLGGNPAQGEAAGDSDDDAMDES